MDLLSLGYITKRKINISSIISPISAAINSEAVDYGDFLSLHRHFS